MLLKGLVAELKRQPPIHPAVLVQSAVNDPSLRQAGDEQPRGLHGSLVAAVGKHALQQIRNDETIYAEKRSFLPR